MEVVKEKKKVEIHKKLKQHSVGIFTAPKVLSKKQCNKIIAKMNEGYKNDKISLWPKSNSSGVFISDNKDWKQEDKSICDIVGNALNMVSKQAELKGLEVATNDKGYWLIKYDKGYKYGPGTAIEMPHNLVIEIFLTDQPKINFPQHDVSIEPKAGSLLIYPMFWTHLIHIEEVKEEAIGIKTLCYTVVKNEQD
tara:strand:- start:454 stop:1035 length:582 start_codon:yes stop_codon:yes gene_type:complete